MSVNVLKDCGQLAVGLATAADVGTCLATATDAGYWLTATADAQNDASHDGYLCF